MDTAFVFIKLFADIIIKFWYIFLPLSILVALRTFIDHKIAQRNAKIEYENRKQAYKDAIKELENEKRGS